MSAPSVLRVLPAPSAEPGPVGADWGSVPRGSRVRAVPTGKATAGSPHYVQGSLAVDFRSDTDDTLFGPQATSTKDLPDAEMWARRMIMAVLEAYDGTRSADQLVRWLTPEIRERAQRRGRLARRRGRRPVRPPHIRALLTCQPADGVCEVSAAVSIHGRVRALALRMSGVDGRWLITAWELG